MTMTLDHVRQLLARAPKAEREPRHRWRALLHRHPILVFTQALLAALPGFLLLLALPIGLLLIAAGWPRDPGDPAQWIVPGLGLALALLGAWLAAGLLRPMRKPRGLSLEHTMAPGLYEWISEAENQWGKPVVDRIVLRSGWHLRIVATPRFGLLPWPATRTLEIGLPLLLTLAPEQFRALLSREIGRAANQHALLSGRLCRLGDLWEQLASHFRRHGPAVGRLLFGAQHRLYRRAAAPACRHDTLAADTGAIQFVNDRELAEVLAQAAVTRRFLHQRFWPKIRELAAREHPPRHLPYATMGKVTAAGMDRAFLQQALADSLDERDGEPPGLATRLEHLGFSKPLPPRPLKKFAAADAIAPASLVGIIREFDRRWVKRQGKKGRKESLDV